MRRISIRWRIALWNTAAFAVVLLGFGLLVYSLLRQTHYAQVDRMLLARYREIADDDRLPGAPEERIQSWVRKLGQDADIAGVALDHQGRRIAQAEQLANSAEVTFPAEATETPQFENLSVAGWGQARRLAVRVPTPRGDFSLMLLAELTHVNEELDLVIKALLVTVPVTLLMAAGLAYLLAYKALAPVTQLRRQTDEITAERLDLRLAVPNPADELGHLALTINSMIARLERSFDEIRRFTADASHELRTPIAVIRSEAEMGLDAAEGHAEAGARFRSILEESNRLASATSQLLALSREDAGVDRTMRDIVWLRPLLDDAVESLQPLAKGKHQALTADIDCSAAVVADAERLRQVFHNLIDNAIKYTPPQGRITLTLRRRSSHAVVEVQDTGIGIPAEHLPYVFNRFYRVAKGALSEDTGAGLGLSIVHSVVTAHHGQVEVESRPGQGSTFRVTLPLAAGSQPECPASG
jgi:heavy metal sensor kinase